MIRLATVLLLIMPLVSIAAERLVTLSVPDMNCPLCGVTLRMALERVDGVKVKKLGLGRIEVTVGNDHVTDTDLLDATTRAGYPSTILKSGSENEPGKH